MGLVKADFEAALKTHYFGPIKDQLENATAFLSRMQRHEEETGGNFLQISVRSGRTSSIGARTDGATDALPAGDRATYDKATFVPVPQYATIQLSGFSMRVSKNPSLALARAQTRDMEDTTKDFKKDLNRQIFGDGSAELCQIVSADTGTPKAITVVNNLYPTNPTKFLYPREKIDVKVVTTGTDVSGGASLSINGITSPTVFTTTATFTATTNTQAVYRENNVDTGIIKEMFGLAAAIAVVDPDVLPDTSTQQTVDYGTRLTGNFGNIDRGTAGKEYWKAQRLHNSGVLRSFSVNLIEGGVDEVELKGGGEVSLLQTNHPLFRVYGSILAAMKQADMAKMELDGGWKALSVNGIPMVKDVEAPDYKVWCLDESTFYLGVTGDWGWLGDDGEKGSGILTRLPGYDQYEGVLNRDMQLMCDKPAANCVIDDIAHS